jgi:pyruvate ferredoxin oxidoreductase gamma subunit
VLDDTLYTPALQSQLKEGGRILVNSKAPIPDTFTFDGEAVAAEFHLPTVNTVMLGIVSALSDYITEEQAVSAIEGYMPQKIQARNTGAVKLAREAVQK